MYLLAHLNTALQIAFFCVAFFLRVCDVNESKQTQHQHHHNLFTNFFFVFVQLQEHTKEDE